MPQKFTLLMSASPLKTQSHLTAIKYIETLISQQQKVTSVFFYQEAVAVANRYRSPPSDEPQLIDAWIKLTESTGIELQACVTASYRRGILDQQEAENHEFESNLNSHFKISGLGQLAAAMSSSDNKLVHFK